MKISCQSCGAKYNIADEKVRGKIVKIACKKCGARIEIDGREPAEQAQDNDETRVFDQAVMPPAGAPPADSWTVSIDDNDQRELTTAQLAELYAQGVVTPDTFVWRDGMADWQAVRDVAALQDALGAAAAPPPAAPAYSEPPTAAYPQASYDPPPPAAAPIAAAAGGYGSPQIETSQPARLGGSRRGGAVDLFAQSAGPAEDEDVATSAPTGPAAFGGMASEAMDNGKPLGARNENSVLFSLSALTASGPAPGAAAAAAPADDEKSGLIDIQKLAASAKTNGAKDDRAKLDDIMNLGGGGAFGSALGAPILAPPPAAALTESPAEAAESKKSNKGLLIAVGGLGLVVVALLLVLVLRKGGDEEVASKDKGKSTEEPSTAKAAKDKPEPKGDAPKDEKTAVAPEAPTAAPEAPSDPGGPIGKPGTAPAVKGDPGAAAKGTATAAAPKDEKTAAPTSPTTKCTSLDCMMGAKDPPKKEEPKAPAASGGEIDKGAVKAALSGVPYKDCGSGGAGKVTVTFGGNGKVSSASVTSGSYDGATKSCIAGRFRSAKVPAYGGDPKTFAWSINL